MEISQDLHTQQPVTIATPPPLPPPQQNILTLALPIQTPRIGGPTTTTGGGREDCWSESATSILIDAWGERYLELSRGNLRQQHWKEVADIVTSREEYGKTPKTDVQCKNRIDTLKKKYKIEKAKILAAQGGRTQWLFFHRLDRLIGPNAKISSGGGGGGYLEPRSIMTDSRIPVGIPTFYRPNQQQHEMDSSSSSEAPDSTDSLPPETFTRKRRRPPKTGKKIGKNARKGKKSWGESIRELSKAIVEFGEAYERTETAKLRQKAEMEKQRMGFAKELEVQRMHFFMKTQLELSQIKNGTRGGGSSSNNVPKNGNRTHK